MKLTTKIKLLTATGILGLTGTFSGLAIYSAATSEVISNNNEKYLVFKGPKIFDKINYIAIKEINPNFKFRYYDFNNDGKIDRKDFTSCTYNLCKFESVPINLEERKKIESILAKYNLKMNN